MGHSLAKYHRALELTFTIPKVMSTEVFVHCLYIAKCSASCCDVYGTQRMNGPRVIPAIYCSFFNLKVTHYILPLMGCQPNRIRKRKRRVETTKYVRIELEA